MSTALVTGSSGHVGSNFIRELSKQGFAIRCIDFDGDYEMVVGEYNGTVSNYLNIGNSTCVYCRSHVWKDFNNNNDEGEQNYINLS